MSNQEDHILFNKIKTGDQKAFEQLFHRYYPFLCLRATQLVKNADDAQEIVQELFVKLWEKRGETEIETSVKNYLSRAVKNQCLNFIKHNQIKNEHARRFLAEPESIPSEEDFWARAELLKTIEESLAKLPEKRREIFRLSREEGLKYREIAEKLNISVKTVETQMGLAIKTLRDKLKKILLLF